MDKAKEPQCINCQQNLKKKSCGACVGSAMDTINNARIDIVPVKAELQITTEELKISQLKSQCRVVLNDPSDYDVVDPFNCKYYMPNYYKIHSK